jgi:tetratricopeptide (TPR) repeat protein
MNANTAQALHRSPTTALVHLKRAYGFIREVESATEDFRRSAVAYQAQDNSGQPFLTGMLATVRGGSQLRQQKAALINDLVLAGNEIESAARIDPDSAIEVSEGVLGVPHMRSLIQYLRGQLEMIFGTDESAITFFQNSLQIVPFPGAHYMLGLIYESKYMPAMALQHFESCLALDADGELSVPALREASAMRNYRKRFRGSWGVFLVMLVMFFPAAFVYLVIKWK